MSFNSVTQFMNKLVPIFIGLIWLVSQQHSSAQGKIKIPKKDTQTTTKDTEGYFGPSGVVRMIKQDKKGNIWFTSWQGVYKYDGKWFTNIKQDKKGNIWFTSWQGVYKYDGKWYHEVTNFGSFLFDFARSKRQIGGSARLAPVFFIMMELSFAISPLKMDC